MKAKNEPNRADRSHRSRSEAKLTRMRQLEYPLKRKKISNAAGGTHEMILMSQSVSFFPYSLTENRIEADPSLETVRGYLSETFFSGTSWESCIR